MNEQEYMSSRLDDQIDWYRSKAASNKSNHNRSQMSIIVLSSLIPLLAGTSFLADSEVIGSITAADIKNFVIGLIGVFIAIVTGLNGLMKYHEKWTEYRLTLEALKHEKIIYMTELSPYDGTGDRFKLFVSRIEELLGKEREQWGEIMKKKEK